MKNNLEILKKAYANETVEIEFDLGGEVVAVLSFADAAEMFQKQVRIYDVKLAEYQEQYGDKPINEKKWEKYIGSIKKETRKRIEDGKPQSLAEQFADEDTRMTIIAELLPKYLKDKEGNLLFGSEVDQKSFGRLVLSTPSLTEKITQGMAELTSKIGKIEESAKNSSAQGS